MTHTSMLTMKHRILSRRVMSLPVELDAWLGRTEVDELLDKNLSQIEALDYFLHVLCKSNEDSFNALDPAGSVAVFLDKSLDITKAIIKSRFIWDFFRDRLELRFVPRFRQLLLMADLVSYDCYTAVMDRAKALQIIPEQGFREYPLVGLVAQFAPSTFVRLPGLQNHNLPVPVIDLPWDHLVNPWELLIVAHEVGHDVDEDLGRLSQALQPAIASQLDEFGTPMGHIVCWQQWTSEILADLVGILLTGPAFVGALAGLLTLPRSYVLHINSTDEHPPPYLRVFINTALVRRLGHPQLAQALEAGWRALYGVPNDGFRTYLAQIEPVIATILDTPLAPLQDRGGKIHSLGELIAFTLDDQARVQATAVRLVTGALLTSKLPIRHVVSASQLAFEQTVQSGDTAGLATLAQHTQRTIIDLKPPGQLPVGLASHRARQHLDDLARAFLERPLDDIGIHWPL